MHFKTIAIDLISSPTMDLEKITLTSLVNKLKDVQVATVRPLIEQYADRYIYNVDVDPESKAVNTFDLLRKMPLITVDAEDNLQLNGSTSYKVLINGKSSSLFVFNTTDVLKIMPASAIKNIEVITRPSSRYDAEGIGGIINIITYKKNIKGYTGSVTASIGIPATYTANGYIAANTGKLTLSGYVGGNTTINPVSNNIFYREDKTLHNVLQQNGTSNSKTHSSYFKTELSYGIDSLTVLTAGYNFSMGNTPFSFIQQGSLVDSNGNISEVYQNVNNSNSNWYNNEFGFDYQHRFKRNKEQSIALSYKYNRNSNTTAGEFTALQKINEDKVSSTFNADQFSEQVLQVDYVQPLSRQSLELGVRSDWQTNKSSYFYKDYDTATNQFMTNTNFSDSFQYRQSIYAAYASFNFKWNKWSAKTGVRLEQTAVRSNYKLSNSFTRQYFNLIPAVYISRMLKNAGVLTLSYIQRIDRPDFYDLNPYPDLSDPRNILTGNPKLRPATSNMLTFTFNKFIKKTSVNTSLNYSFSNNAIQRFTTLISDTVALTTFGNIGKNETITFSFSCNTTIAKKLNINMNSNISYNLYLYTTNGELQRNAGYMFNIFSNMSYRFNKGWRLSSSAGYNSQNISLQGKTGGYAYNTLTAIKEYLKNKNATFNFTVNNPFQNSRHSITEIQDPLFYQRQDSYTIIRRFTLSFNYRFGKF